MCRFWNEKAVLGSNTGLLGFPLASFARWKAKADGKTFGCLVLLLERLQHLPRQEREQVSLVGIAIEVAEAVAVQFRIEALARQTQNFGG